eukprot:m.224222 g.224222  ORF g.224222 m.224222 type:complete len:100 (-) comp17030_c11_seq1:20-319(-)
MKMAKLFYLLVIGLNLFPVLLVLVRILLLELCTVFDKQTLVESKVVNFLILIIFFFGNPTLAPCTVGLSFSFCVFKTPTAGIAGQLSVDPYFPFCCMKK